MKYLSPPFEPKAKMPFDTELTRRLGIRGERSGSHAGAGVKALPNRWLYSNGCFVKNQSRSCRVA